MPSLFRAANRIADALGLFSCPLSSTDLIDLARKRTGLAEFGDRSFELPLARLLSSYQSEADLSAFGRLGARWDTLRLLKNLLVLQDAERKTPAILDQRIVKPIFITGLPRSGTTFLHELMSADPAHLVVRCWETIYPWPTPAPDRRRTAVSRQLSGFTRLAPEISVLHPMSADSPQECSEITAHVFASLRFDTTHHVPSYREWLDRSGHKPAYLFHKRFLQHLQHQNGSGRWVLKCPDHVFALDAIRAVYPDAVFVFVHRNPLDVLPSVAKLTEVLRRPFTRQVDRFQIGRQVSERWGQGAEILVAENASSDSVYHIKFQSLVEDPVRFVAEIYDRFGMLFTNDVRDRIKRFPVSVSDAQRARAKSRLADFGLDEARERDRFRNYMSCFAL